MMKRVLSSIESLVLLVALLTSCSPKEGPIPDPLSRQTLPFAGYTIKNYKLYVGSKTGGIDVSSQVKDISALFPNYLQQIPNRFELEKYDQLRVTTDSIQELPARYDANRFTYKTTTHDSLFRWNIYSSEWQFYGYKRVDGSIEYLRSFYRFSKMSGREKLFLAGMEMGSLSEINFIRDNPYRFKSLADMTSPADTILFCNLVYAYKR